MINYFKKMTKYKKNYPIHAWMTFWPIICNFGHKTVNPQHTSFIKASHIQDNILAFKLGRECINLTHQKAYFLKPYFAGTYDWLEHFFPCRYFVCPKIFSSYHLLAFKIDNMGLL